MSLHVHTMDSQLHTPYTWLNITCIRTHCTCIQYSGWHINFHRNDWRSIPYSLPVSSIQCHIHTQVVPWMGYATQLNMEHWVYTHLKQQALIIRRILNRHSVSCLRTHVAPWMDPRNTPEHEHCMHTSNTTDNYVNWKNTVCMYVHECEMAWMGLA